VQLNFSPFPGLHSWRRQGFKPGHSPSLVLYAHNLAFACRWSSMLLTRPPAQIWFSVCFCGSSLVPGSLSGTSSQSPISSFSTNPKTKCVGFRSETWPVYFCFENVSFGARVGIIHVCSGDPSCEVGSPQGSSPVAHRYFNIAVEIEEIT